MGVAGSGKSTLGAALAASLGWDFVEADQHHPPENIRKMSTGIPLADDDRWPWLHALRGVIEDRLASGSSSVLACSALRESYRRLLRKGHETQVPLVYLKADPAVLEARLSRRRGHYMGPGMLDSQLQTLEEPRDAVVISAQTPVADAVAEVRRQLGL